MLTELQAMRTAMEAMVISGRDYYWSRGQGLDKLFGVVKYYPPETPQPAQAPNLVNPSDVFGTVAQTAGKAATAIATTIQAPVNAAAGLADGITQAATQPLVSLMQPTTFAPAAA